MASALKCIIRGHVPSGRVLLDFFTYSFLSPSDKLLNPAMLNQCLFDAGLIHPSAHFLFKHGWGYKVGPFFGVIVADTVMNPLAYVLHHLPVGLRLDPQNGLCHWLQKRP